MAPKFFASAADFAAWLKQNHLRETELLVGYYKKDSGRPSMTWPESVDAALCFGWIDGVRRRIDEVSYSIRFTPRKARSVWSAVNMKRVEELAAKGLLQPAGAKAFAARVAERSAIYSFEQEKIAFPKAQEREFRANRAAWKFFQAQPPWYQRAATWWVINAKRTETKTKRLATLIEDSAAHRTLRHLTRPAKN
jgi:uncharacterized protein YdeI (YjbR/CyaY-like superfamily)